jgi:hypothetical protein
MERRRSCGARPPTVHGTPYSTMHWAELASHAHAPALVPRPSARLTLTGAKGALFAATRTLHSRPVGVRFLDAPRAMPHSRPRGACARCLSAASRSSDERCDADATARIAAARRPACSSASTPAMVVPPGEHTYGDVAVERAPGELRSGKQGSGPWDGRCLSARGGQGQTEAKRPSGLTWSLSSPGCLPVSSTIAAAPLSV